MDAATPKPKQDYRLEELDGEFLLYHPGETKTIYLSETASLIWGLCDGTRTVGEITELLRESYPDAAENIGKDVEEVLSVFANEGVIDMT